MWYKGCPQRPNAEVANCDVFATRNPLESQERRRLISPTSKLCAETLKLWSGHQPITQNFRRGQMPLLAASGEGNLPLLQVLTLFGRGQQQSAERLVVAGVQNKAHNPIAADLILFAGCCPPPWPNAGAE